MKALEVLKSMLNIRSVQMELFEYCLLDDVKEAIKELEQDVNKRTCEGCRNLFFDEIEKVYKCSNDVSDDVGYLHGEAVIRNIKAFHCVQHQPKDNQ